MADSRYIVDIFDDIVQNVRTEYNPGNNLEPYYDYGHFLDIQKKLLYKDKNDLLKFRKFPMVVLLLDTTEDHDPNFNIDYTFSPRVLILDVTEKSYTSQERMTNVFKQVLYPIYEILKDKILNSEYFYFQNPSILSHSKTDRMSFGSEAAQGNSKNIFNEHLDCIDLTFNNINVYKKEPTCEALTL